jgi:uncharacterized membrane protein
MPIFLDDISIARALHVLAVVHWIGGVAMVTLVILPSLLRSVPAADRLDLFERIEGRFGRQARISTVIAGASGLYMTERLAAWDRFADPAFWWMHLMLAVWAIFTVVLFIAEPLFLHRWFHDRAMRDPDGTFRLVWRLHVLLLSLSLLAVGAAVLGAHGALA